MSPTVSLAPAAKSDMRAASGATFHTRLAAVAVHPLFAYGTILLLHVVVKNAPHAAVLLLYRTRTAPAPS